MSTQLRSKHPPPFVTRMKGNLRFCLLSPVRILRASLPWGSTFSPILSTPSLSGWVDGGTERRITCQLAELEGGAPFVWDPVVTDDWPLAD